jgi:hypothetical protein
LRQVLALAGLLALTACDVAPARQHKAEDGASLLRVIYRDADAEMVLMVPEQGGRAVLHGDCTAPLLIDARSGAVRVLSETEVQTRLRTMSLAGATRGVCP